MKTADGVNLEYDLGEELMDEMKQQILLYCLHEMGGEMKMNLLKMHEYLSLPKVMTFEAVGDPNDIASQSIMIRLAEIEDADLPELDS